MGDIPGGILGLLLSNPILNAPQTFAMLCFTSPSRNLRIPNPRLLRFTSLVSSEFVAVSVAINLNHQSQPATTEIDDVLVTGPLPSEKIARHFALFHLVSQLYVRHGVALPEFPRALFQLWVMVKHDLITLRSQTPALPKETSPFKGGIFSKSLPPSKQESRRAIVEPPVSERNHSSSSMKIFHQHQIAADVVELREQQGPSVRRNGKTLI